MKVLKEVSMGKTSVADPEAGEIVFLVTEVTYGG